jgi:ribonuclease-3
MSKKIINLTNVIQHSFNNEKLLLTALTHRSVGKHNNERLEFLGDALLSYIIAEVLFKRFPNAKEGQLTRLRANLVKGETLAKIAKNLNLGEYIFLGKGELKTGGWRRSSILEDALESVIAAIYLDAGIDKCKLVILNLFKDYINNSKLDLIKDAKTRLQEYLQANKIKIPQYNLIKVEGEAHDQYFEVECIITHLDKIISARGNGKSRRNAEQISAEQILNIIKTKSKNGK